MFRITASLGIEIGNNCVRAALLYRHGQRVNIRTLVSEQINDRPLSHVLVIIKQRLRKAGGFPYRLPKHQAMALAQSQVAIKQFAISADLPADEQYLQIGVQLAESVGLQPDELLYDYYPIAEQNAVEAFACRRTLVADTFSTLAESGYRLSVLELQTQSLLRLYSRYQRQYKTGSAMLVSIDNERIQLFLSQADGMPFYRELPLVVNQEITLTHEHKQKFTEELAQAILRQQQMADTQFANAQVHELLLCGEEAERVDSALLQELVGIETGFFNPLRCLFSPPALAQQLPGPMCAWSSVIGLALRGVDHAAN